MGTKERLAQNDIEDVFKNIYYPFLFANRIVPMLEKFGTKDIKIKIFSDNILLAYPVNNRNDKDEILAIYNRLSDFLRVFLSMFADKGILFRGAMTVDKLFINELMVWGKGLLTVVDLEENIAIYPRVVLSEDLLKIFDEFNVSDAEFEDKFSCFVDPDDCVYFDFFNYYTIEITKKQIAELKSQISQKITEEKTGKNRPRVMQKYCWFRNYINLAEGKLRCRIAYGV